MKKPTVFLLVFLTVAAGCFGTEAPDAPKTGQAAGKAEPYLFDADEIGTVDLPVSCSPVAAARMEHGLALMHHMMYTEADLVFQSAVEEDPFCGMGYWGRAMSVIHTLWSGGGDIPTPAQLDQGSAFVEQALALDPKTERERAYIAAVGEYFRDADRRAVGERLLTFHQGWQDVHELFPEDPEATAFFALTSLALGEDSGDPLARQSALALMKGLLDKIPDHPAGHHYAIHAYDYYWDVPLDPWAVEVARSYGKLTPEVPHALHMPTHVFTNLGLWSESIDLNERSAAAAWEQGHRSKGLDNHYPHALAYLNYAYLQTGQDARAKEVVDRALSVEGPFSHQFRRVFAAHLNGMPVRYALERHAWDEAAQLKLQPAPHFPWSEEYSHFDAVTHYGRTIGLARGGDAPAARKELERLQSVVARTGSADSGAFLIWDGQLLMMAAEAWIDYADGKTEVAVTRMAAAAERELSAFPLGPGELLPASEQLGDMYLELDRYDEALAAYEASLERLPNRLNSVCGAARAAELGGESARAKPYYETVIQLLIDQNSSRECVGHARAFLTDE